MCVCVCVCVWGDEAAPLHIDVKIAIEIQMNTEYLQGKLEAEEEVDLEAVGVDLNITVER